MGDVFLNKVRGCVFGGVIGDALGTPTEGRDAGWIKSKLGWVEDFETDGTDDTILRNLLIQALDRTDGYATLDDWAQTWVDHRSDIFGEKVGKFFVSVLHTASKLGHGTAPRMCALGNMPSSSSAMAIAPVGVVNACNPRAAARQAYDLASLIHVHDVSFCQDGAAAIASAVAEAFKRDATPDSVIDAALGNLHSTSGSEMHELIHRVLATAQSNPSFEAFTVAVYREGSFFRPIMCDSRETIPLTLALFRLANGDFEKMVTYAANFGRDSDTIGTMGGAIAGALQGIGSIRTAWREKLIQVSPNDYEALSQTLALAAGRKILHEQAVTAQAADMMET